ncbi:MAG: helix-turn-helix domain-containing protein, partial [Pseudomonadota bacterium]
MTGFARSLKTWRAARRLSQLDLAIEAEISSRHLSFLETGRSNPSREMVIRLSEALGLPLDARNQMLTQAGFAVRYKGRDWNDAEMAPVRRAVNWQLDRHAPYPGLAVDRLWTIRQANATARTLFGAL